MTERYTLAAVPGRLRDAVAALDRSMEDWKKVAEKGGSPAASEFHPYFMERETGIEPATNGLGSRDSTTELLPPEGAAAHCSRSVVASVIDCG